MIRFRWALLASASLALGCAAAPMHDATTPAGAPAPTISGAQAVAERPGSALAALEAGRLDEVERLASRDIAANPTSAQPRILRAIVRHKKATEPLVKMAMNDRSLLRVNPLTLAATLGEVESALAEVEADLAVAAKTPGLGMELCIACWNVDWNSDGEVDELDQGLFQIAYDEKGEGIPEDDPRRKPTFRFDDGDVAWARAWVSFERAALDVLIAYDWTGLLVQLEVAEAGGEDPKRIVVPLVEPKRIAEAKKRILEGLVHSDAERRAYLAETDDDREWVPNPRQQSHPMPLHVDQALYDTWEGVVSDVRKLVQREEGIPVLELVKLLDGQFPKSIPVNGYIDVGEMLDHPKNIEIDLEFLERRLRAKDAKGAFSHLLGAAYVRAMKPSRLPARLERMKTEIERGDEEIGRKLRYLLWLN
ncbi:hypothetical protein A7982_13997 [Minicystis rosea]|nr:hypothetical protein A7982_13997 [Minicystis rosea]